MASDSSQYGFSDRYQTSESTPGSSSAVQGGSRAPVGGGGLGARRRKVPESVTLNACTNCKRARAKCDGAKPQCKRCSTRNVDCHYEIHSKTAKEHMVREIQRLQKENESLEVEKERVDVKNDWIEQTLMKSLEQDKKGTQILRRLKRGHTLQQTAEWLGRPLEAIRDLSPTSADKADEALKRYHSQFIEDQDPRYWTGVTSDPALIHHLVRLYLVWIHPVHMLFDQTNFMSSFRKCEDAYCSAALVNAICAMSCHLYHGENLDQDPEQAQEEIDYLRTTFLEEVYSNLKGSDYSNMTVIQTYAILFLVELGCGNGQLATSHLRLATESCFANQQAERNPESEGIAALGVLTLHTCWSGFTYQKPSAPISATRHLNFDNLELDRPDDLWCFYRYPGDERNVTDQPSYSLWTVSAHAKLYDIIHETILQYCAHEGRLSASELLNLYKRYLDWKGNLPRAALELRTPHCLFLHIQYHTALVNLLQPLLEIESNTQESYSYLLNLMNENCIRGLDLLKLYRLHFTYQYQSPLQLFSTVHICDTSIRFDKESLSTTDTIRFCLESLQEAKVGYSIARPLQQMFCISMAEYQVPIPEDLVEAMGASSEYEPEHLLDACTRPTYKQPLKQILPNLDQNLGVDFVQLCEEAARRNSMKIDSLLNS